MDGKPNDSAVGELIHYQQYPMALQQNRLTPKQVNAPKAIFSDWSGQPRFGPLSRDPAGNVVIRLTISLSFDLLCNSGAESRVARL